ncbi:MAG TPA: N-acetylmuramoyl-L-alanine amidase [Gemmatimonadaceae bacterium]|nr:N-acetylmuramoyl-L-alanine amidase [Gemmatimonadaceae bacterium]
MITALAVLLQITVAAPVSAAPASHITVRTANSSGAAPIVRSDAGAFVSASSISRALGGSASTADDGRFSVTIRGATVSFVEGVPFARVDSVIIPMTAAPYGSAGASYVPLHFVTELLPRIATGLFYDVAMSELRVFNTAAQSRPQAAPERVEERPAPASTASVEVPPATPRPRRTTPRRVVVDAGHGGVDNGMTGPIGPGPRINEKHITLAVSRLVAEMLRAEGVDVVMTRTRDTLIALSDRGRIANRNRADLFISVHVNAAPTTWRNAAQAGRGFETYFLAEAKTEEARRVEQMENESVRFETGANAPKGDPLSFIINDMAQNEHLRESNDLAESIQQGLARIHPGPNRGVKQANFAVLRTSFMPAVLVEIGFGTNPEEAAFMNDLAKQRVIARAIADGALEYLDHYEQRVGGTR